MADETADPGTGVAHRALGELRLQEYGNG